MFQKLEIGVSKKEKFFFLISLNLETVINKAHTNENLENMDQNG